MSPAIIPAPSQDIAAVRINPDTGDRELVMLRWELIPFWAKDKKIGYKMINARAESVSEKPAFRAAFKRRRCLIPALGFYEWNHKAKTNQPYFIRLKDSDLLAFAGLWEHWEGENEEVIESCTIITTEPNEAVGKIHDRMPAMTEPEDYEPWLSTESEKDALLSLIKPFPDERTLVDPVGKLVNNPTNDEPGYLEEV